MKLLKKLYIISSPSNNEQAMQSFIISLLKGSGVPYTQDNKGNIYATKGESDTYPCVVCHMDEVHKTRNEGYKVVETDGVIYGLNTHTMSFEGIGADDKNGIWVCIKALNEFDAIKCAFFVAEEVGCQGSRNADMTFFDDCRFVLQCDRKGNSDFITNASGTELCSSDFLKAADVSKFGYKEANGMMTDVMELKENGLKVSACNISCGYYNPHSDNEMTRISDLRNCYNLVRSIILNCTDVYPHKYVAPKYLKYSSYNYGYSSCKAGDFFPEVKQDKTIQKLKELHEWAWKDKNGDYMVYSSDMEKSRPAKAEELFYTEKIDSYKGLFDYYDDVMFDKDGNPIVRNWNEKEFHAPDEGILNEVLNISEDDKFEEYCAMQSEMSDYALLNPDTFSMEEFMELYGSSYPNMTEEDYRSACEETVGCIY